MEVVMALMVILHTTMFYLSYRRIVKVRKTLTHEANIYALNLASLTIGSFIVCLVTLTINEILGLVTQGYFGPIAIMSNTLTAIDYIVLEALYFIVLTQFSLDFTMTTKVLADGNVLIVCLDSRGNETLKLYMNDQIADEGLNPALKR